MRSTDVGISLLLILAVGLSGCYIAEEREKAHQEQQQAFNKKIDMNHIFVSNGDPPSDKKYTELGSLSYTEPFSPDAIDEGKIKERLKQMAYQKWPDDIDGVFDEQQQVNNDTVTVTAKGVKFEDSADREAMHNMNNGLVVSPSGN